MKRRRGKRWRQWAAAVTLRPGRGQAAWLTWATAGVLGLLVLSFEVTDPWSPPGGGLRMLIWAAMHRPTFVPLVLAMIVAPVLSVQAWRCRGPHRAWLAAAWLTAVAWLVTRHGPRLGVMFEVLWWRVRRG